MNSLTQEPFSKAELDEISNDSLDFILRQVERFRLTGSRPAVLEIGCGRGELARRLQPHGKAYTGIDFSEAAIEAAARSFGDLPLVRFERRSAGEIDGYPERSFDLIVLDSVVQYFSSMPYLLEVVAKARKLLSSRGILVLCDLRNSHLRSHCYTFQAIRTGQRPGKTLTYAGYLAEREARERELFVSPEVFSPGSKLREQFPGISISLRLGALENEVNAFRYHVAMHADPETKLIDVHWLDPLPGKTHDQAVRQSMERGAQTAFGVRGQVNSRYFVESQLLSRWSAPERERIDLDRLRASAAEVQLPPGLPTVSEWLRLARGTPYQPQLRWDGLDRIQVIYVHRSLSGLVAC